MRADVVEVNMENKVMIAVLIGLVVLNIWMCATWGDVPLSECPMWVVWLMGW